MSDSENMTPDPQYYRRISSPDHFECSITVDGRGRTWFEVDSKVSLATGQKITEMCRKMQWHPMMPQEATDGTHPDWNHEAETANWGDNK